MKVRDLNRLIVLSGEFCSGKSYYSKYISNKYNYELAVSRLYFERILHSRKVEISDFNMQNLASEIISQKGSYGLTVEVLNSTSNNYIVYDSFRNIEEVDKIKKEIGSKVSIIFLDINEDERYKRHIKRIGRNNDPLEFIRRKNHAVENEVKLIRKYSDLVLSNLSIQETKEKIDIFIASIKEKE